MKLRFFQSKGYFASVFILLLISMSQFAGSSTSDSPVELATSGVGPRQVEDATRTAVERDYANAWQSMSQALNSGDATSLDHYWTGVAADKLHQLARDEQRTQIRIHYTDHSHQLQAVFYPTDGSALLLHDTVEGDVEILNGGKVVESQPFSRKYVVLMTPGQDRWFVRIFESVPAF